MSNLALCFSKPLFCIAGPDPDSVGSEVKDRIFNGVSFFGDFFSFYVIQHCFICRPSDSTVSEDAGIESRTVACDFGIDIQTL
jgi:hypothetical protein